MTTVKVIHALLALASGVLLIGYGGMDDSPGAQGIGLLTSIGSLAVLISVYRNK